MEEFPEDIRYPFVEPDQADMIKELTEHIRERSFPINYVGKWFSYGNAKEREGLCHKEELEKIAEVLRKRGFLCYVKYTWDCLGVIDHGQHKDGWNLVIDI